MFDDATRAMIAGLAVPPKVVTFDERTINHAKRETRATRTPRATRAKRHRRLSPYNMYMRRRPSHVSLQTHARRWKDVPLRDKRSMADEAAEAERSRRS